MDMRQMKTMMIVMMMDKILYINKAVNTCTEFMLLHLNCTHLMISFFSNSADIFGCFILSRHGYLHSKGLIFLMHFIQVLTSKRNGYKIPKINY